MSQNTARITRTITVTKEEMSETENYLKTYGFYRKLLQLDRYSQEYFSSTAYGRDEYETHGELTLAHAKMFDVRHFIMMMQNCDEKLFLYQHYIRGESVERCAELLGISLSSAFRLKKRALAYAADEYAIAKKKKGE
jgi:hypothetical protein